VQCYHHDHNVLLEDAMGLFGRRDYPNAAVFEGLQEVFSGRALRAAKSDMHQPRETSSKCRDLTYCALQARHPFAASAGVGATSMACKYYTFLLNV
jgi:hypothetical protein